MSLSKKSLSVLPMPLDHVEGIYDACRDMTREKLIECVKRIALSHERLRAELAGATVLMDEREAAIREIDATLRIEAAEYVPAIGDVFTIIDRIGLGEVST
jgi:hypothetical protein